ncbi:MAG TPA: DUF2520 domain-containing protein [Acidimicrobiia bacterium]|nr:DUF2520 domain-containing protein [Acidimicrobiia bacterium]
MHDSRSQLPSGALALVGPGRAGTTVAVALAARGWTPVALAGRSIDAPSTLAVAERLGARVAEVVDAGRDADLVIVATPDAAIADTALALAPGLRAGALVVHLSGACPLEELDKLHAERPDVAVGALHPLQSLPSVELGLERLPGSWCAVDGPPAVERLALSLGMRPFRVAPGERARYHAAATIASNHLVALLGQAVRVAEAAGVPPEAMLPLVRASVDNVEALGARDALTGPVARGDVDTVVCHLDALAADEQAAYRALAREALRLSGRDDAALRTVIEAHDLGGDTR